MWLAVDIGNTNIHIGAFEDDVLCSAYSVKSESLKPNQPHFPEIINQEMLCKARAVVISSVNPNTEAFFIEYVQSRLLVKPKIIGKDIPIPISILTEQPEKVGADRLVNALAAFELTKNWTIVIDAGTAITIDGINEKGAFLGGIITPGIDMSSKSLHTYTALLPEVSIKRPARVLGKNTIEAINSGIYWGTTGMVRHLINMLCDELQCQPTIIATGGNAHMLAQEIPLISGVFPHLTLEGIKIAYKTSLSQSS